MKFKTQYEPGEKKYTDIIGESRTKQQFKEESDANNIIAKYSRSGVLPDNIRKNPMYGDFTTVQDYQTAVQKVMLAQEQFMGLGAEVRDRFQNDPAKFLEFVNKPENVSEMVKLGLATYDDSNDENGKPKNIITTNSGSKILEEKKTAEVK